MLGLQTQAQLYNSADVTYQGVDPITCCDIPGNSESPYVTIDGNVPDLSYIGTYLMVKHPNLPDQTLRITGVTPKTDTPIMDIQSTTCAPCLTTILELESNTNGGGKTYDLLGREINEIERGTMYIQNKKLYIKQ